MYSFPTEGLHCLPIYFFVSQSKRAERVDPSAVIFVQGACGWPGGSTFESSAPGYSEGQLGAEMDAFKDAYR